MIFLFVLQFCKENAYFFLDGVLRGVKTHGVEIYIFYHTLLEERSYGATRQKKRNFFYFEKE